MPHDPFTAAQIETAWDRCGGYCECCRKRLSFDNQGRGSGWGAWEAHMGNGRVTPVILCTGVPESCHLYCGHNGNFQNPGITPRFHRGA